MNGVQKNTKEYLFSLIKKIFFIISLLGLLLLIYDAGFETNKAVNSFIGIAYQTVLFSGSLFILFINFFNWNIPNRKIWFIDGLLAILFFLLLVELYGDHNFSSIWQKSLTNIAIVVFFFRTLSSLNFNYNKQFLNPAQIFLLSFISIIFIGTFLLLLPNATYTGMNFIDALFTSTSAVCVTGLVVVDTGTYFTYFGQWIIILLIQAGGVGIMTFTSYFGYFFKGGASFQNRLMIQDMNNMKIMADVFSTLKTIIITTLIIEFIGGVIIYYSIQSELIPSIGDRFFFSLFHSISGFCNAGFSTLSNSLYEPGFRYNYLLHITIAFLFILGGLGFPIVFNALNYIKHLIIRKILKRNFEYSPWVLTIDSRIVLITTLILLVTGTLLFYFFEYDNTLSEHNGIGKFITAFFGAATPRTAGFNTVDTSALKFSTIIILLLLMWIGASPGSTGGGIKTSTLAIFVLNILSLAKGKDRIEIFHREISPVSTRRAFAILSLSILVIGLSILFLVNTDGEKGLLSIAFESFSAFSTVGLSLGITDQLSTEGKIIIIITMFIGRVSMFAILVAFLRKMVNLKYKYPIEDVQIN